MNILHKHLTFEKVVRTEMSALVEEGYNVQNLKKWVDKLDNVDSKQALVTDEFWKRVDVGTFLTIRDTIEGRFESGYKTPPTSLSLAARI